MLTHKISGTRKLHCETKYTPGSTTTDKDHGYKNKKRTILDPTRTTHPFSSRKERFVR